MYRYIVFAFLAIEENMKHYLQYSIFTVNIFSVGKNHVY